MCTQGWRIWTLCISIILIDSNLAWFCIRSCKSIADSAVMEEAFMTEFSNCSTLEDQVYMYVKLSSTTFIGFISFSAGCLVLQKPWNIWHGWGAPLPEKELEGWGRGKKGELNITSRSTSFFSRAKSKETYSSKREKILMLWSNTTGVLTASLI